MTGIGFKGACITLEAVSDKYLSPFMGNPRNLKLGSESLGRS